MQEGTGSVRFGLVRTFLKFNRFGSIRFVFPSILVRFGSVRRIFEIQPVRFDSVRGFVYSTGSVRFGSRIFVIPPVRFGSVRGIFEIRPVQFGSVPLIPGLAQPSSALWAGLSALCWSLASGP